ncbi:DUF3883 domain-containing protein [Methylobacillus flagellatus]|uniref:DUF3883 domain-containing protein n=1 Tax=Methylobacillus flagellatus TaxID=405 RepID=UPI0010F52FB9|nr:DUF3883 domain-containing protein [Methylobacillus flagellatus]
MSWSRLEVEATVADYFHMLVQELAGQSYNKSAHRKVLIQKLDNRSEGAIERKHQNISAVLISLRCPYISGYKPLGNYQALLREVVEQQLSKDQIFDQTAISATALPAIVPIQNGYASLIVDPPQPALRVQEAPARKYMPQRRDYLEREARNASLGLAGEEFVLQYEHFRLYQLGKPELADKVEHVAKTQGDGLGFDVLSFETSGQERFIEVKTTAFGKETPFFISRNEVSFAKDHTTDYQLYRLYNFRQSPKMFQLAGPVQNHCQLDPVLFVCEF